MLTEILRYKTTLANKVYPKVFFYSNASVTDTYRPQLPSSKILPILHVFQSSLVCGGTAVPQCCDIILLDQVEVISNWTWR